MDTETVSPDTQNQRQEDDTAIIPKEKALSENQMTKTIFASDKKIETGLPTNIIEKRRRKRGVSEITEIIKGGLDRLSPENLRQFIKRLDSVREKNLQEIRNIGQEETEPNKATQKRKRKESDTRLDRTYEIARMLEREKRLTETLKMPLEKMTDLPEIDFIQLLDTLSTENVDDLSLWFYEKHQLIGEKIVPLEKKDAVELSKDEKDFLANLLIQRKNLGLKYLITFNYLLERQKREH